MGPTTHASHLTPDARDATPSHSPTKRLRSRASPLPYLSSSPHHITRPMGSEQSSLLITGGPQSPLLITSPDWIPSIIKNFIRAIAVSLAWKLQVGRLFGSPLVWTRPRQRSSSPRACVSVAYVSANMRVSRTCVSRTCVRTVVVEQCSAFVQSSAAHLGQSWEWEPCRAEHRGAPPTHARCSSGDPAHS